ncbi:MAG TPA: hypothetical protein DCR14_09470 [Acidimicrobiaceae bacterium]|nr:hypothetical protein [Acidimicrobiaceae bacterium]
MAPMYLPDILTAPLRRVDDRTSDLALLDTDGLQIGVWECLPGTAHDAGGDFDETMLMVAGSAEVRGDDGSVFRLAPDVLWATPRRWGSTWAVEQTVRKLYVIDGRAAKGTPSERPAALAGVSTSPLPAAEPRPVVLDGDPHEASADLWESHRVSTGVWECTPGTFPFRRDGYHEVFCILSGHATLHTDEGMAFDLRPGAVLLTPAGLTGRWEVHELVRKAYTIVTLDEAGA